MDEVKNEIERLEFLANVAASHGDTKTASWAIRKAAQQNAHLTGGGLCAECGSPAWTHSVRDHAFVEPHHTQVA